MSNLNYRRGREKEYKIVKRLKAEGYDIAQRTAGSHSPIDVIGINIIKKQIKLIQSKPVTMSDIQKEKLITDNIYLNGYFWVSYEVE